MIALPQSGSGEQSIACYLAQAQQARQLEALRIGCISKQMQLAAAPAQVTILWPTMWWSKQLTLKIVRPNAGGILDDVVVWSLPLGVARFGHGQKASNL